MFSHFTSDATPSNPAHQAEQKLLSQWIIEQPAYKATAPDLANAGDATFSPDQIDAIIAIRKRIAAQQSHD
ncbi:hypothetical protein [Delftia acidovorans]|uniref:hypothetical protein n=1 Tax=Delftia acidovorans TaxID=80866 RepID=UPI00243277D3|nr:hypothetical protein [Delftia acidovorans]